tara:strand:- start:425 stop:1399 length:975 start_codon:yes stop_codon:yes gene_type:complete
MQHAYEKLSHELILEALEQLGLQPSGRILTLNSYENRVFQIEINEKKSVIGKFYRPDRWSDNAIEEEHKFSLSLSREDIPVVAPLSFKNQTLFSYKGFRFSIFPSKGGRAPNLENLNHLQWIGRLIGRIHLVGAENNYKHRYQLDSNWFGWAAREAVLKSDLLPQEHRTNYEKISAKLIELIEIVLKEVNPTTIKLHGDCHPGNILWTDTGPHFVDMDDSCNGPAIQDLWMLLSGEKEEMREQILFLLDGYESFCDFNKSELNLIEALRGLRQINYTGWVTKRWSDPAFPIAFPWFMEGSYWHVYLSDLAQQIKRLDEPLIIGF